MRGSDMTAPSDGLWRPSSARAGGPSPLPHTLGFLLPPLVVASVAAGGWWTWLPVAVLYAGVPLVDALVAADRRTRSAAETRSVAERLDFRLVVMAWVPVQVGLIAWAAWWLATHPASRLEALGLIVSVGSVTGTIGFTFAHELIHRHGRLERLLGDVLLATTLYPHFAIEHVECHHRHVGTPLDPVTARRGESLYGFLARAIPGGVTVAARIEAERCRRRGRAWWWPGNRMVRYAVTLAVIVGAVGWLWGVRGVVVLLGQAAVAVFLLESVNYVEHYGLVRRRLPSGRYERVSARHSWDSCHRVSNWLLINLARHSDHHVAASKRYQELDPTDEAPQLPAGYGAMLLAAVVPPLWFRLMDPRLPPEQGA